MKRKRKDAHWQFIKLVAKKGSEDKGSDLKSTDADHFYCYKCKEIYDFKSGDNSVRNHMDSKHKIELRKFYANMSSEKGEVGWRSLCSSYTVATREPERSISDKAKENITRLIALWIGKNMRPISIVEDAGLSDLIKYIAVELGGVDIKLPSRNSVKKAITSLASEMRGKLREYLSKECLYYSCTTDIWTDRRHRSYVAYTIHFLDTTFKFQSWTLEVDPFEGKHTGERIAGKFQEMLKNWGLEKNKLVLLIRDGASNGKLAGKLLKVEHISCVAHSLHLVVGGALIRKRSGKTSKLSCIVDNPEEVEVEVEVEQIEKSEEAEVEHIQNEATNFLEAAIQCTTIDNQKVLNKVRNDVQIFRDICVYFHRSSKGRSKLLKIQFDLGVSELEVVMDCPTRWNSTHDMLARLWKLKSSIDRFFLFINTDIGAKEFANISLQRPTPEQWILIRCLLTLLHPIWFATKTLSGEGYPTLAMAYPMIKSIERTLTNDNLYDNIIEEENQAYTSTIALEMHSLRLVFLNLYQNRFSLSNICCEMAWVSCLDPRLKSMQYVDSNVIREKMKQTLIKEVREVATGDTREPEIEPIIISPATTPEKVQKAILEGIFGPQSAKKKHAWI